MSVTVSAIWAYAGFSCRETEAQAISLQQAKKLRDAGFGFVEVLLVDGKTEVNRHSNEIDRAAASCLAHGLPLVGWATPRPAHVPIEETVGMLADAVHRYGLAAVRYQTEAEFEYSNPAGGGTPASRYMAMETLGAAHRRLLGGIPTSVYVRGSLQRADAYWAAAWRYKMRPGIEIYGVNETPTPAGVPPRPDFGQPAAKESALPALVAGWWYRVRLGKTIDAGRITDDGLSVWVPGKDTYPLGSAAGPRFLAQFGDPKWGAVLNFFPGGWLKPVVAPYGNPQTGRKPTGLELASEIRAFQSQVRKHGPATKGYTVWAGAEMEGEHYQALSPKLLTGAALLP